MILKKINIVFAIILLLFSCKKENMCDCIKGTGKVITEKRNLKSFNHIFLNGKINLYIYPNSEETTVEITAGENLINLIKTDVKDSSLKITNNNHCNWVRSFKNQININLYTKDFKYIDLEGSGSIYFMDTLHRDYFQIDVRRASGSVNLLLNCKVAYLGNHSGVADITASGKVEAASIPHTANAPFDCSKLICSYVYGRNESKCDTWINVNTFLKMKVQALGNVYYYGSPKEIESEIIGTGKLIKLN